MFSFPRGRYGWTVPILLFAAVVLVAALAFNLANLESEGEFVPDVPDAGGTPPTSGSLAEATLLIQGGAIVFLALLLVVAAYAIRHRKPKRAVRNSPNALSMLVRLLALLLVLVAILAINVGTAPNPEPGTDGDPAGGDGGSGFPAESLPTVAGIPLAVFLAAGFFVGLLVVWLYVRSVPVPVARPTAPRQVPRDPVRKAVLDAISELEFGGDVRSAILACFYRFCSLLGARGFADQQALTPRQLEDLAIAKLGVSPGAAEDLTSLFEEARYSEHELREEDRRRALGSLERIRTALEA